MATSNLAVQNWFETTLTNGITASTTTIDLNNLPTGEEGFLVIEPDSESNREVIYFTSKTGSAVVCPSVGAGRGQDGTTNVSHSAGSTVRMQVVAAYWESLQDGSAFDDDTFNPSVIEGGNELIFDHVASGCVWSGDAYASTRAASMTSGVVYINGTRVAISSVSARTFTASRDTYVDVGTDGTLDYTEVTNNNASPALAADHIRLGIIITGASNIANAGSINQGEEDKVLPIASSVPYAVTDSLGNLICPRDPQRKFIGFRRLTSTFSTVTVGSNVDITGLSMNVIVPTGKKIRVRCVASYSSSTAAAGSGWDVFIIDGSTTKAIGSQTSSGANYAYPTVVEAIYTPTPGTVAIKAQVNSGAGTYSMNAGATRPAFLSVELV